MAGGWGASLNGRTGVAASLDHLDDNWGGTVRRVVGSAVHYAVHVEFGTSSQSAQPFLRPAVRHVVEREGDRIADDAEGVEDLVARLALAVEAAAKENAPVDTGALRSSIAAQRIR